MLEGLGSWQRHSGADLIDHLEEVIKSFDFGNIGVVAILVRKKNMKIAFLVEV